MRQSIKEKQKLFTTEGTGGRAQRTLRKDLKIGWFTMVDSVICFSDNLTCSIHFLFFNGSAHASWQLQSMALFAFAKGYDYKML
jgi:hypothetical protein